MFCLNALSQVNKGRPELASELYWVACGYEEKDKREQAKQMYERVVKDCPGTDEAGRAALDIRRRILCDVLDSGDVNSAYTLLDTFIADFKQNYYAGDCLGRVVIGCYKRAVELREQKQPEKAMRYREISANIWERIQKDNLQVISDLAYLYFYVAINYHEMGRWADAINNYQKVLEDWPDFEHACGINAAIAACYESLRDKEGVPKEGINPLIEEAYKAVLANATKAGAYSWVKAPRYLNVVHEVGALARMYVNGDYTRGISALDRIAARAYETKKVADAMDGWLNQISVGASSYQYAATPASATGIGLTEAPRGALGHWITISGGTINRYQVITPTNWNASPRDDAGQLGPIEQALVGTPVANIGQPIEVLRVVHSFDPCLSCAVHMVRPGKTEPEMVVYSRPSI